MSLTSSKYSESVEGVERVELSGLDWYSASGQRAYLPELVEWCRSWWGEPELLPGRHCYHKRLRFGTGAEVLFDEEGSTGPNREACTVILAGGVLAEWTFEERIERTFELAQLGMDRPRRVDAPIDLLGHRIGVLDEIMRSRDRHEVVGPRTGYRIQKAAWAKGELRVTGDTVYLGQRGNGSFSFCAYDKGLQRSKGRGERGEWIRLEPRFEGPLAELVMVRLWLSRFGSEAVAEVLGERFDECGNRRGRWVPAVAGRRAPAAADESQFTDMRSLGRLGEVGPVREEYVKVAFSRISFREASRSGSDRHLRRRAFVGWWCDLLERIQAVPMRLRVGRRRYASLDARKAWLRRTVFPGLVAMANATHRPVEWVLESLGYRERGREGRHDRTYHEYVRRQIESAA